jgi:SAM-dependent methyltransferase
MESASVDYIPSRLGKHSRIIRNDFLGTIMDFLRKLYFQLRYLYKPRWDTGITPPEVEAFIASRSPGKALDLGCGTGTNAIFLARCGWDVTGVDFIERAVQKAQEKARAADVQVKFLADDVTQMKGIPGLFDLILDIGCLHSLPLDKRPAYLKNVNRLLHPQGTYLLYAFVKNEAESGPGLAPSDLSRLEERLELVERQDGTDRDKPAAWFTWQKPIDPTPVQ